MKVLFVCAANANRSPAAEFFYNQLSEGAQSAGLQPAPKLDERMMLALLGKYRGAEAALEAFFASFKPRSFYSVEPQKFDKVYAMDKTVLQLVRRRAPGALLFPKNGVKDPAAVYPTKSGDPYLDVLNDVEKGVRIIMNRKI